MQTNKFVVGFLLIGTFVVYAIYTQQSVQVSVPPVAIVATPHNVSTSTAVYAATTTPSIVVPVAVPTTSVPVATDPAPVVKPPVPVPTPKPTPKPAGLYRDGTYTGDSVDVYYGNVQVAAVIQGGKITDVQFLDHPQDRGRSIVINDYAMPNLVTEAIQAQSANVDGVSGATATSGGFVQSLASALAQAKK